MFSLLLSSLVNNFRIIWLSTKAIVSSFSSCFQMPIISMSDGIALNVLKKMGHRKGRSQVYYIITKDKNTINTNISVIRFYEYIKNISKILVNIFTKISV